MALRGRGSKQPRPLFLSGGGSVHKPEKTDGSLAPPVAIVWDVAEDDRLPTAARAVDAVHALDDIRSFHWVLFADPPSRDVEHGAPELHRNIYEAVGQPNNVSLIHGCDRKEPLERRGFSSAARKSQASDNMIFIERTLPRSGTTPPDRRCVVD